MVTSGSGHDTCGGASSWGVRAVTTRVAMSSPETVGALGSTVGSGGLFGESATSKSKLYSVPLTSVKVTTTSYSSSLAGSVNWQVSVVPTSSLTSSSPQST